MSDALRSLVAFALLTFLLWFLLALILRGLRWAGRDVDAIFHRMGKGIWHRNLPGLSPVLRFLAERKRREEEARRRKAEAEARRQAEQERAQKERDALVDRPIPPEIKREMRAFLEGQFVGEDQSPLAYVGYRVGKTRGLIVSERRKRLDACFRIEIPPELPDKYHSWGPPVTYQRFCSIEKHLTMLIDMRSGRRNQRFAVADWTEDRSWFSEKYGELASLLQRHPPRRYW